MRIPQMSNARRVATIVLLLIVSVIALIPFVYMLLVSFLEKYSLSFSINLREMSFVNYRTISRNFDFFRFFVNSVVVTSGACILNCIVSSMAGYGFAKKKFRGSSVMFFFYVATLMIPAQIKLIPTFLIMHKIGLLNTYLGLMIPIIDAFGVFLMRQFMVGLPDEIIEATYMDGCGEIRTFSTIILPLVRPVLVSLLIFTFITSWNNFIWPLVIATESRMSTLTLALSTLQGNYGTNYGLVMAGATLSFIFPFLLYLFLQKEFVEGIAMSGIKG